MERLRKFEGSIDQNYFLQGLLLTKGDNTPGHIWEKCVNCTNCLVAKQCSIICGTLEEIDHTKNPKCRDIINILLGEMKVEDIK
jgi:hypothetical protein